MKKRLLILLVIMISWTTINAQRQIRIGYVDMDYIFDNVPDYREANQQLNKKIQQWKGQIELKKKSIKDLKDELDNERPLLTKDLIDERQDEIDYLEKKLQDYQQEKFGPEGAMIANERQIRQPIQDQIFNAVQEIGEKREYDFIFDSSADALMLFSANRHDISDQVLASITRNSKRTVKTDKNEDETKEGEPIYKSVRQARIDKEDEDERQKARQEKLDARQAQIDERQQQRDSIIDARKTKREKMQEEHQAERDSINNIRKGKSVSPNSDEQQGGKDLREIKRDSIRKAKQEQRENLIKERQRRRDSVMDARKAKRDRILKERQEKRDSIMNAQQKAREEEK